MQTHGPVVHVSPHTLKQYVQVDFTQLLTNFHHKTVFKTWVHKQEEKKRLILYEADWKHPEWVQLCVRSADAVILVG